MLSEISQSKKDKFSFLTSLLEYNCFTVLCQFLLYNKVNRLYAYVYPHIPSLLCLSPTLSIPPLQVDTQHRADLPVLCGCFPLAMILHLVVYICPCHSLTLSQLTLPPPRVLKSILYICIFIPDLPLGSSEPFFSFFFQIPYICVSIRYLFFSSCLTSLCMTVSRSIHLTTNNSISFLFMAE